MASELTRRRFIEHAAAIGGAVGLGRLWAGEPAANEPQPLKPIGQAKGVHPGRVVWVHDPEVTDWKGPGDGRWYQANRTKQERVDQMVSRAVCDLAGDGTPRNAWDKLFRHFNRVRGKGDVGYRPGEKVVIKPNWVGMIWREGTVDPETYTLVKRQDYMNTAPQMIIALLRQLVGVAGVAEADISVCDTLAYLVHEYYDILHGDYPEGPIRGLRRPVRTHPGPAVYGAPVLELPPAGRRSGLRAAVLCRGRVPDQLCEPESPHRSRGDLVRQEPLRFARPLAGAAGLLRHAPGLVFQGHAGLPRAGRPDGPRAPRAARRCCT